MNNIVVAQFCVFGAVNIRALTVTSGHQVKVAQQEEQWLVDAKFVRLSRLLDRTILSKCGNELRCEELDEDGCAEACVGPIQVGKSLVQESFCVYHLLGLVNRIEVQVVKMVKMVWMSQDKRR